MSKQFTVITKDGSKWLRPTDMYDERHIKDFALPYLGSRPDGTVVDESEVVSVVQYDVNGRWISNEELYRMGFTYRIAYTDAESHNLPAFDEILNNTSDDAKMNVSLQMDLNYWKLRCEAAEKLIGISPSDPKTYDEFCRLREEWQQIVKQEPK